MNVIAPAEFRRRNGATKTKSFINPFVKSTEHLSGHTSFPHQSQKTLRQFHSARLNYEDQDSGIQKSPTHGTPATPVRKDPGWHPRFRIDRKS